MYAVIMAGGKGERLWPKSTKATAKHTLSFGTKNAMIQLTIKRLKKFLPIENIFIVTSKKGYPSLKRYVSALDKENIILEPEGKDTAAAICLSALILEKKFGNSTMVVLPADHIIKDSELLFKDLVRASKIAASNTGLVTIGVNPKYASVGYGYIKIGRKLPGYYVVKKFTEKPEKKKAEKFYKNKHYLWNSGIFIWQTGSILSAFKKHMPNLYYALKDAVKLQGKKGYSIKLANEYSRFKNVSIDYGVMEPAANTRSQKIFCVKGAFDWIDIGSWASVEEIYDKNAKGNIILSNANLIDVRNSIIIGEKNHKIGIIGINDVIIVQTKTGTLICNKNRAQEVKALVRNFS